MLHEKILILGATGSVGESAIKIIRKWSIRFSLLGFSYHSNFEKAKVIQKKNSIKYVACSHPNIADSEKTYWKQIGVKFFCDLEEILEIDYDKLLTAVVGAAGVKATYKASQQGKTILIANKESLVMAGEFIMNSADKNKTKIIPVDSEHNSLFRLVKDTDQAFIQKVYITASGGPFYHLNKSEIKDVKKSEVLAHPNWDMGSKISVDSASMANKALEIIEACHLFQFTLKNISAVIHPQSYIHAILKYKDGSYFFHASEPDMLYPLSHSLFYPEEPSDWIPSNHNIFPDLTFSEIDHDKYPTFYLGLESAQKGGVYPAIFNASNEEAVYAFLNDRIKFHEISNYIDQTLNEYKDSSQIISLDDLFEVDSWTRECMRKKMS